MKLNQAIAIRDGKKGKAEKTLTKAYQTLTKRELFSGVDRTYRPKNDDGDKKPSEKKIVQLTVKSMLDSINESLSDMINIVATVDTGNCEARADIVINDEEGCDGLTIENVPAPHIIFLEKQVEKLNTFIESLPTLDAAEEWKWNPNTGCYASEPRDTTSTSKVLKSKVLYEATDKHPAQIEKFSIDEIVGYWTTISLSGCIKADDKRSILKRLATLSDALKMAREQANSVDVEVCKYGNKIMSYIISG